MDGKTIVESRPLEYQSPAPRLPLSQRINFRLWIFIAVVAVLIGYPVYVLLDAQLSGGIKDAGGGYKEVDLKAMSLFSFDQTNGTVNDIPRQWRELDGQKVVLYGEMWATMSAGPYVDSFQLCYSIAKCCFSGPPQVQHFVHSVPMKNAQLREYPGLVKVQGILHVNVVRDAGKVASVYQLEVQNITPPEGDGRWFLVAIAILAVSGFGFWLFTRARRRAPVCA